MPLSTKEELKAAMERHLDDDLAESFDDFIVIAEARHQREVRIRQMLVAGAAYPIGLNVRTVALPDDFLAFSHLRIRAPSSTSGRRYLPNVDQVTVDQMTEISVNDRRCPQRLAVHETIEFDCETDQAYDGEIFYYKPLDALADDDDSNPLLERAADVYLYSALGASAPFLLNDERIDVWETLYIKARDGLNALELAAKRGTRLVARVHGRVV